MGTLYIVATPIGNLEDITHRAVNILREMPLIAAEDTRTTRKLMDRYQISSPLTSYHEHNKDHKTSSLLNHLQRDDLALVSDAGTPGINDPGFVLIRAALDAGHSVIPVPGPSAPITALSVSGLPTDSFHYLGYVPRKSKQRKKTFREVQELPHTLIFLESPHRIKDTLRDLESILGTRQIAVARELTKIHEEIFRGSLQQARDHFQEREPRGEFTLVVEGAAAQDQKWSRERLLRELQKAQDLGEHPPSAIAKQVAEQSGWKRSRVYDMLNKLD